MSGRTYSVPVFNKANSVSRLERTRRLNKIKYTIISICRANVRNSFFIMHKMIVSLGLSRYDFFKDIANVKRLPFPVRQLCHLNKSSLPRMTIENSKVR